MAYPKLLQSERMLLGLAAAVTLAGASGCLGAPPRDRGKAGDDAGAGAGPPGDLPLPRLSRDEYVQTLRDLTTQVLPSEADQVLATVIPLTKDLPRQRPRRLDAGVGRVHARRPRHASRDGRERGRVPSHRQLLRLPQPGARFECRRAG